MRRTSVPWCAESHALDGTWEAIAITFGQRWVRGLDDVPRRDPTWVPPWVSRSPRRRAPSDHSRLALPMDSPEVAATRAWLSLCELARHSDELAQVMAPWLEHESRTIGRLAASSLVQGPRERLDEPPPQLSMNALTAVGAVVHGLRQQMVRRLDPLGIADAHEALRTALAALLPLVHPHA